MAINRDKYYFLRIENPRVGSSILPLATNRINGLQVNDLSPVFYCLLHVTSMSLSFYNPQKKTAETVTSASGSFYESENSLGTPKTPFLSGLKIIPIHPYQP